ncbi:MAG: IgGFc-binding protein [Candidatus Kapaibacterium sp.]|nr:IgGFc-binding protein [Ignavibacteriota bacterium]MCB9221776.1 IgGFc-binding protein [Ignavibacteria bacterium]
MIRVLTFLILLTSIFFNANSQVDKNKILLEKSPEGKEFWLCFMRNHNDADLNNPNATQLDLKLFLTSDKDASVTIEIKSIRFKEQVFVKGGTVKAIQISPLAQVTSSEIIESGRALHVTSDVPISVYGLNRRKLTTDTFMGLPVNVLGTSYRVMCYDVSIKLMAEMAVVATEDSTLVTITPTVDTDGGHKRGRPFSVTLNKGDVYQVAAANTVPCIDNCDLTGSLIESNKKIAVFSGHQCAYVPTDVIACNHLVEQVPPLHSWGKHFYIGAFKKRSFYNYRVLANKDGTRVFEDSKLIGTLNAGQHLERETDKSVQVTASNPVLVAQFSQGFDNGDRIGDPMMCLISPTQQFLKKYRFATPVDGFWEHFVNVVAPTKALNSIRLNGIKVDVSKFKKLGDSRYSFAQISVNYGTHVIECSEPFGMTSYGFGYGDDRYDAYGSLGGQSFSEYVETPDKEKPFIDYTSDKEGFKLLIRDDRNNDRGIAKVNLFQNTGFDYTVSKFEAGTPLVIVNFGNENYNKDLSVKIEATDLAGNIAEYTLCYTFNQISNRYQYTLQEGLQASCGESDPWEYGVSIGYNYINHFADFSNTGGLKSKGTFSDIVSSSFEFGLLATYRIDEKVNLMGRLNFMKYSGTLQSPDSTTSFVRKPLTGLSPFRESVNFELEGLFTNVILGIEYLITNNIYVTGGLQFDIPFSKSVKAEKEIIIPQDYNYDNGTNKTSIGLSSLGSLNTVGISANLGLGFRINAYNNINAFLEAGYAKRLTNMVDDANWTVSVVGIRSGIRFPLK